MFSKKFIFISGVLSFVAIMMPELAVMGLFLFLLPGIVLWFSPTVFIYACLSNVLKKLFSARRLPYPSILSIVVALSIGCAISAYLNIPVYNKINKLLSNDTVLQGKLELPETIAIFSESTSCGYLCQKFLYNGAVKQVLLDNSDFKSSDDAINRTMVSYRIKQGEGCQEDYLVSDKGEDFAIHNVRLRISSGECLVKLEAKLIDADMIPLCQGSCHRPLHT
jgi:hypothetical protein